LYFVSFRFVSFRFYFVSHFIGTRIKEPGEENQLFSVYIAL
jgi:hypothetical protein